MVKPSYNDSGPMQASFSPNRNGQARCELHRIQLVHRFPNRCPLAAVNPLASIYRMRQLAFDAGLRFNALPEIGESVWRHHVADVCSACIDRNLTDPAVRHLRRSLRPAAVHP